MKPILCKREFLKSYNSLLIKSLCSPLIMAFSVLTTHLLIQAKRYYISRSLNMISVILIYILLNIYDNSISQQCHKTAEYLILS